MAEINEFQVDAMELFRLAGNRFAKGSEWAPGTVSEVQRLLQELDGDKIELEAKNAALGKAMEDVEAALEKYTCLYNLAPVSHLTLDREGIIQMANLTCSGLLGVARSRLIDGRFDQFVADESRAAFAALLRTVFAGPGRASCELALLNGNHSQLFVLVEAVTSGEEWHIALIDITRRKQHAEAALPAGQEAGDRHQGGST